MKFLPFEKARRVAQSLGLTTRKEWLEYCRSGSKPEDIPSFPDSKYKKEWKGMGDWLGTGTVSHKYRIYKSFEDARLFVHSLGLKSMNEWDAYCKTGKKPEDIPKDPTRYKKSWKGWGDWLGTGTIASYKKIFRDFEKSKQFVHNLNLHNREEWIEYCHSGKKPQDIPIDPSKTYKADWVNWKNWIGQSWRRSTKRDYRPFLEAQEYVQKIGLKSREEWYEYYRSGKKPEDIPSNPDKIYKAEWAGWGKWLGTGFIAATKRKFRPFQDARDYVRNLGFKSRADWDRYRQSPEIPNDIPANPGVTYAEEWKGWGDWLGTGAIAPINRKYRPFQEAREYAHGIGFKSVEMWRQFCKSSQLPLDVPGDPVRVYKEKWKGWGDWLGTGNIALQNKVFLPFEEARTIVRSLGLKGWNDWVEYCRSGKKTPNIPWSPSVVYPEKWNGIADWLGYEETFWSVRKVKELLRDLIQSRIIYQWDEAVLYSFFLRKGLLNLQNRHSQFFSNLIEATSNEKGRKLIEEYAYSNSEIPPDLSDMASRVSDALEEIQPISTSTLSEGLQLSDPLDYQKDWTVEEILSQTDKLESINVDDEAMEFYLDYSVDELWRSAFNDGQEAARRVQLAGKNGNKYHDMVIDTFLRDYRGSTELKIPRDYSFPFPPTLMQLYVAYKVANLPYFGNFSGTGAGKTLSAILASRIIDSKITVIVCPNDVVDQWKRNILDTFPNSRVITGKDAFYIQNSENQYQYAVLNYDKFSQEDSPNLIIELAKQKVDFIILDEIHFTKIRNEEEVSQRRKNLDGLMTGCKGFRPFGDACCE